MDCMFSWTYSEGSHPNKHSLQGLLQQEEIRYLLSAPLTDAPIPQSLLPSMLRQAKLSTQLNNSTYTTKAEWKDLKEADVLSSAFLSTEELKASVDILQQSVKKSEIPSAYNRWFFYSRAAAKIREGISTIIKSQ